MKYVACGVIAVLAVLGGIVPVSYAQDGTASVAVVPQIEDGHQIFAITGTGFPAGDKIQIRAINRRTQEGLMLNAFASTTGTFDGVAVGKTADGEYFVVSAGTWNVRAKSGTVVAKTTFESRRRVPEGMYASDQAALRVTATGGDITFPCADGRVIEPLFVDAQGNFSARAVLAENRGPVQGQERAARIDGTLSGRTITFTVTILASDGTDDNTYGPVTVYYNRQPTFERCT